MKIVKVCSCEGSLNKNKCCEKAPDEILKAFKEFYTNEESKRDFIEVENVKIVEGNIEETHKNIYEKAKEIKTGIFIGGDHSITYSLFKGFSEGKVNPGLVIFDAHLDCVDNFKFTHEDFVRVLIEEKIVKAENVVIVGVRNMFKTEVEFLKGNKIKVIKMKEIFGNINYVCDSVMEIARSFSDLYVSLDIDVVDPAFAPGTGYCEPGGLSSREFLYFIQRMKLLKNLKVVDIVEINPDKDLNNLTIALGAKVLSELT